LRCSGIRQNTDYRAREDGNLGGFRYVGSRTMTANNSAWHLFWMNLRKAKSPSGGFDFHQDPVEPAVRVQGKRGEHKRLISGPGNRDEVGPRGMGCLREVRTSAGSGDGGVGDLQCVLKTGFRGKSRLDHGWWLQTVAEETSRPQGPKQ
jgi:hypothetical protein